MTIKEESTNTRWEKKKQQRPIVPLQSYSQNNMKPESKRAKEKNI